MIQCLREHRHEIITGTIMTLISMAIAIAAKGDINEVFAPHRGR
jgi:hypothetical protein